MSNALAIYDRFLVIGSGGREHAIISALHGTRDLSNSNRLYLSCAGTYQNPGITSLCDSYQIVNTLTELNDIYQIVKHALVNNIEVAIVGPEAPLQAGIVNQFVRAGIPCIGPTAQMAEIETDKAYTRNLFEQTNALKAYNPQFFHYRNRETPFDHQQLSDLISDLNLSISLNSSLDLPISQNDQNYVIKAVGLKGGKGVKVGGEHLNSFEDTYQYCQELINADGEFIIEEKLVGDEFSLISLSDGRDLVHLPIVQDYKRAFEGDEGPNTGGMGSILLPSGQLPDFLTPNDVKEAQKINQLVLREITNDYQDDYTGVLYGSFIKCGDQLKIIEYNARFGDPEVINIMHSLQTDLSLIFSAMIDKQLINLPSIIFSNRDKYILCRYLCPSGYPTEPIRGSILTIDPQVPQSNLIYASLTGQDGKYTMLGSRALAVVTENADLSAARNQSDNIINQYLKGRFHYRTDIGHQYLREESMTYQDAGVNIDEANQVVTSIRELVKSTHTPNVVTGQYGNFGGSYHLNPFSPTLVTSMDGVGTKVQTVLNLLPRAEAFESLGRDLFSSNVNDILCLGQVVRPLFFLDYFGCQKLDHRDVQAFVKGLAEACRVSNCVLIGGETAELPDFTAAWENYHQKTTTDKTESNGTHNNYELVGTVIGSMYESVRFNPQDLKPGQRVLALKSSGPHTNGYSLINRLITTGKLDADQYRQELCQSHRNYYPDLVRINQTGLSIEALCHITGGGLIENPPRILPQHLTIEWREEGWTMPSVFQAIQAAGNLTDHEMHRTFNCGLGLLIIVNSDVHPKLLELFGPDDLFYVGDLVEID